MSVHQVLIGIAVAVCVWLTGCDNTTPGSARARDGAPHTDHPGQSAGDPNRVAIPASVRQNLGVRFATVERRPVRRTLRAPGQFELRPEARREYHAMIGGRVELLVEQFEHVEPGDELLRIDSPKWRSAQHEVVEARGHIPVAQAALRVAEATRHETEQRIELLKQRIASLEAANVRRVDLETQLEELANTMPRLGAQVDARKVELAEAHEHYASRLNYLAALTGLTVDDLKKPVDGGDADAEPILHWQTIDRLTVTAESAGIVDSVAVTQGAWVQGGARLLSTTNPSDIRFHAHAPQADIARLRSGLPAQVVPPRGGSLDVADRVGGELRVGFRAHPDERVIPLYLTPEEQRPEWARAGVTAYLEVYVDGDANPELAVPQTAIVRDGLDMIFFRRDPKDPNRAIRIVADLGVGDGQWVEVLSGVKEGDEVVVDGAYALKLATSDRAQAPDGYHYHADGSLHKDH